MVSSVSGERWVGVGAGQKRVLFQPAGGFLVREARGRATSTEGNEEFISMGTIVVSNGLRHVQMLRVLREGDAAPLPQ